MQTFIYICILVCVCAELVPFWELRKTNNGNVKQFSGFSVALLCTARWGAAQRDAANDGKKKRKNKKTRCWEGEFKAWRRNTRVERERACTIERGKEIEQKCCNLPSEWQEDVKRRWVCLPMSRAYRIPSGGQSKTAWQPPNLTGGRGNCGGRNRPARSDPIRLDCLAKWIALV